VIKTDVEPGTAAGSLQWVADWIGEPPRPPPPLKLWCSRYRHDQSWRSIHGPHLICAICHPPARGAAVDGHQERDGDDVS